MNLVENSINMHFFIIITKSREVQFSIWFLHKFHHTLLMEHEFCCGDLVCRRWRA